MTYTRTETVVLADAAEIRFTIAEPDNVVRGGLVVLHEARGVTERVRRRICALAADGWLVVAPHLYHRDGVDEVDGPEQVTTQVRRLSAESILDDADAAFRWLAGQGVPADLQGVIGFDVGGTAALLVAARRRPAAAVTIGGCGILSPLSDSLPAMVDIAGELACPWLGLYADELTGVDEVEKLRSAAAGAGVATDVVRFPGTARHADTDPSAGRQAWQRTRNWFDLHLR